ncbi:MAG TPA: polymer-forming cytoskeletal protein [Dongiaceae bacterium]
MFSKADRSQRHAAGKAAEPARGAARSNVPSIISADLRITGDLHCSGDIQIDGVVNGDIQSRNIVIGEGAAVTGSLQAETVQVFGKLIGQIKADTVTLERTAHVTGDILHRALAIAQGAFLEGACKRLDTKPAGDTAASTEAERAEEADVTTSAHEVTDTLAETKPDSPAQDEDGKVKRLQVAG